jgi:hypothetical protein
MAWVTEPYRFVAGSTLWAEMGLPGRFAPWGDLAMWPPLPFERPVSVDVSGWSLDVELGSSPALLVLFWTARRRREASLAVALLCASGSPGRARWPGSRNSRPLIPCLAAADSSGK